MKLAIRLALMAVSLALVAAGGASWLALREVRNEMEADARRHAEEVTVSVAQRIVVPVLLEHEARLTKVLEELGLHEGVVAARVVFVSGHDPIVLSPRPDIVAFTVSAPVLQPPAAGDPGPPHPVAHLEASFTLAGMERSLARIQQAVLVATLLLFGVAAAVGFTMATWITRRVRALATATERVAHGDLASEVEIRGADEIAALGHSLNAMVRALARSREELRAADAELARRERLASLGQFTAMIAHEIRNPLGIILASAQVARNSERTPEQREQALGFIVAEVHRLNRILDDFLRFARPREPVCAPVDLQLVAEAALKRWDPPDDVVARAEPADPESAHPRADADGDQLAQALLNLTLNAAQAGAKRVTLRYGRTGGTGGDAPEVFIEVEDDGPGFPEKVLAKAGEPFVTTRADGSGLGLAVVHQIVRAHVGHVEITPVEPHGARVRLVLPGLAAAGEPKSER